MSMPLRLADSEKPVRILPLAGHTQSTLSSPSAMTAAGFGSMRASTGGGSAAALGSTRATITGGIGSGGSGLAATEAAPRCTSRNACSEYGSLTAFGCALYVSVLGRAPAGAAAVALASPAINGGIV